MKKNKKRLKSLFLMLFLLAGSSLIVVFVGKRTVICEDSMEPVLSEGL